MWKSFMGSGCFIKLKVRAPRDFRKSHEAEHQKGAFWAQGNFCVLLDLLCVGLIPCGGPGRDHAVDGCTASHRPVRASLIPALWVKSWTTNVIFAACSSQAAVCRHCLGFCVSLSVFPVVFLGFYFSLLPGELGAASTAMCLYLPEANAVSYLYSD